MEQKQLTGILAGEESEHQSNVVFDFVEHLKRSGLNQLLSGPELLHSSPASPSALDITNDPVSADNTMTDNIETQDATELTTELTGAVLHDEELPKASGRAKRGTPSPEPTPLVSTERLSVSLPELRELVAGCTKCRLCDGRTQTVFGSGETNNPRIAFVGEGPGAEEDLSGEPFVGRAGKLLTAAITQGIGIPRESVFICNVVKCRPPENRAPHHDEALACFPYLERQLELIAPQVIVTLGNPAQMALVGRKEGITKLRGIWHEFRGIPLMPTLHPAYILRSPGAKKDFWADLQAVMERIGLPRSDKTHGAAQ